MPETPIKPGDVVRVPVDGGESVHEFVVAAVRNGEAQETHDCWYPLTWLTVVRKGDANV